jgi:ferredoxin
MAYRITEKCIACGSCFSECPNGAIKDDGIKYAGINPDRCTECVGAHQKPECRVVCPIEAPEPDPKHKESHDQLLAKWKKLHPGKTPRYV